MCSLDTQEYSDQYPVDQWRYLKNGVLIHSTQTGLIHYRDPEHFPIARTPRGLLKRGGEMLNPAMQSWGAYELARHLAEKTLAKQHPKPPPATPNPAPGSMEWQAEQDKKNRSS